MLLCNLLFLQRCRLLGYFQLLCCHVKQPTTLVGDGAVTHSVSAVRINIPVARRVARRGSTRTCKCSIKTSIILLITVHNRIEIPSLRRRWSTTRRLPPSLTDRGTGCRCTRHFTAIERQLARHADVKSYRSVSYIKKQYKFDRNKSEYFILCTKEQYDNGGG